jgi:hypothetical protein
VGGWRRRHNVELQICTLHKYYYGDYVEEDEMGGTYGEMHTKY